MTHGFIIRLRYSLPEQRYPVPECRYRLRTEYRYSWPDLRFKTDRNTHFGYGGPWNKLVRREMLTDNGIKFDARTKGIFDDIIYSAYILAVADKVAYVPRNVYNYRILESSITHTFKANVLEINDAIFTVWGEFLDKYNKDGTFTAAYYANVLRRFDDSIQRYFFNPKNPKSKSERLQELQTVVDSAPYKDIPKYVEIGKLERRHLEECKLLKKGSAKGVQCFYSLMGVWRRLKGKS